MDRLQNRVNLLAAAINLIGLLTQWLATPILQSRTVGPT
jgi:hypothetical protein